MPDGRVTTLRLSDVRNIPGRLGDGNPALLRFILDGHGVTGDLASYAGHGGRGVGGGRPREPGAAPLLAP